MPACPRRATDERVVLWLQNSHAAPIPPGAVALDRMGAEQPVALTEPVAAVRQLALDVATLLPDAALAGADRAARRPPRGPPALRGDPRRAHPHRPCQRGARRPAARPRASARLPARARPRLPAAVPGAAARSASAPSCSRRRWRRRRPTCRCGSTCSTRDGPQGGGALPRPPDARSRPGGRPRRSPSVRRGARRAGLRLPRRRRAPTAGCTRCSATRTAQSGHVAESSFGAHIFNTLMTYRDEPQSYSGPPPGLSTRLFLKLGDERAAQLRGADLPGLGALAPALRDRAAAARRRRARDRGGAVRDRLLRLGDASGRDEVFGRGMLARPGGTATCWCATPRAGCSAITG